MSEKYGFPEKNKGISTAGVTIHIESSEDKVEPFDVTLYIKKPRECKDLPDPDGDNSFTATGKLSFRFGKRVSIELFAENTRRIDETLPAKEEEP